VATLLTRNDKSPSNPASQTPVPLFPCPAHPRPFSSVPPSVSRLADPTWPSPSLLPLTASRLPLLHCTALHRCCCRRRAQNHLCIFNNHNPPLRPSTPRLRDKTRRPGSARLDGNPWRANHTHASLQHAPYVFGEYLCGPLCGDSRGIRIPRADDDHDHDYDDDCKSRVRLDIELTTTSLALL
jgi:hypothetical protein